MKSVRVWGWKYRAKGELAHYFNICRSARCSECDNGYSHAACSWGIMASWFDPGFSKTRPPHRWCPECQTVLDERERVRNLPWRERMKMRRSK